MQVSACLHSPVAFGPFADKKMVKNKFVNMVYKF
jgi:hypothetical protein